MSGAGPVLVPGAPPRIGRFRIAAKIGAGSASRVYLAMDTREGVWRALKVLAFDKMGDERSRSRFRRECETAMKVSHPHLLAAYDASDDPYTPWLALEVCEGGSLGDWVERHGPMPAYQAIEVMVQVCAGLAAAHRQSVAQRRLEPRDVLIDRHGKCKLTDFRPVTGGAGGLSSDSPDLRDDVVGAGNVLHFLLTGRPYREPARDEGMSGVPDALQSIVHRAMQRGRGMGYPDAAAMGRDLEVAVLEVSMPSGMVPALVDREAYLPDTVEALFDPDERFEDLERAARWAADPEAGPKKVERDARDLIGMVPPAATPAPRASYRRTLEPQPARDLPTPVAAPRFQRATPFPTAERPEPQARLTPDLSRRQLVTPAPVSRSDPTGASFKPDYLVDEAPQQRDEGWRTATPQPVRRTVAEERRSLDLRMLAVPIVLLVLVVAGLLGKGAYDVKQARIAADDAGENLTAVVEVEGAVVNDLAARGADRQQLEERFFAYREARGEDRYREAQAFADALLAEAAKVGVDPAAPLKDNVSQRVAAIREARGRYLREREVWAETASGFPGRFPVVLGLAGAPD